MATALGDFFLSVSSGDVATVAPALQDASRWPECNNTVASLREFYPASHVALIVSGDVQYLAARESESRGGIALAREPEQSGVVGEPREIASQSIAAWLADAKWQPIGLHGRYVFVLWDAFSREVTAFCDMFRTYPLYYMQTREGFICASDMRLILLALGDRPVVNKSAVYHYLNFAYMRLTTRSIAQMPRADDDWRKGALAGGYWIHKPAPGAEAAIVFSGAVAPEVLDAFQSLKEDLPGLGLLNVTSPDLLHRGWSARRAARWTGTPPTPAYVETLLAPLSRSAGLVTVLDGSPAALSWLGAVRGQRVSPLGVDRFGQTGDLLDLHREYRLDAEAIIDAATELFLGE